MDKASVERSMSNYAESSAAAMYSRSDDAMTRALRGEGTLDIDELIYLNRTASPVAIAPSTLGSLTTTVFSSQHESNSTKPTSDGTRYPVGSYNGKAKAMEAYAASLSATQGSGSEAEAEHEALRERCLAGVGDWAADGGVGTRTLKGSACKRPRMNKRHKKPVIIIQQEGGGEVSSEDEQAPATKHVARGNGRNAKYLRQRRNKADSLHVAEEGRDSQAVTEVAPAESLSRARLYVLIGLYAAIGLTLALSGFAAHYTGKDRMACTKGIIFAATVLVSLFTMLAMIIAQHALQVALLAGLFEFIVGFALVVEIADFVR